MCLGECQEVSYYDYVDLTHHEDQRGGVGGGSDDGDDIDDANPSWRPDRGQRWSMSGNDSITMHQQS